MSREFHGLPVWRPTSRAFTSNLIYTVQINSRNPDPRYRYLFISGLAKLESTIHIFYNWWIIEKMVDWKEQFHSCVPKEANWKKNVTNGRIFSFFLSINSLQQNHMFGSRRKKRLALAPQDCLQGDHRGGCQVGMTHEPGIIVSSVTDTLNWVSAIWFATYWNIAQLHLQQKNLPLSVVAGGGRPLWRAGLAATRQACPSGPGWGSQTGSSRT